MLNVYAKFVTLHPENSKFSAEPIHHENQSLF